MKFTSEDLMKAMGLSVGDIVILNGKTHTFKTDKSGRLICKNVLKHLIDVDFEILPRPKRVGDMLCDQNCLCCPLRAISCFDDEMIGKSLYDVLDWALNSYADAEIYDLLKARLDKVVE